MLERRPRRAEVVLLTHEFAIGLPPVLRDGYRHFLRAANLRLLHLDQDLTNSLRGIKRQNQRLFTRLCGNPATCPRSSLTVERIVDRMARIFRANEHRRDSANILLGGATTRHGLMCCQNVFAQHLILHVLETGRRLHTTFQRLPASPRDLRCDEYTHAIAVCRNQKKRPGTPRCFCTSIRASARSARFRQNVVARSNSAIRLSGPAHRGCAHFVKERDRRSPSAGAPPAQPHAKVSRSEEHTSE